MKIVLDGEPVSQARMKFSSRGGFGRVYDPREKVKKEIKLEIAQQWKDLGFIEHPRVSFVFHMPILKTTSKKQLPLFESGYLKHEKKPDVDNLIKLYLDCMDNICFDGDQQVQLGPCVKLYHPQPKTIIFIESTSSILLPYEVDSPLWYSLFGTECDKCSSCGRVSPPDSCSLD